MWDDLKSRIRETPAFRTLAAGLAPAGADAAAAGLRGGARSLLVAALAETRAEPMLVIAADPVGARDTAIDLELFGLRGVVFYPEDEMLPYDYHEPDRDLAGMQMKALEILAEGGCRVLVCTFRAAMKKVVSAELFRRILVRLERGTERDPHELAAGLVDLGYERRETVEGKGQFALRGGILDLFPIAADDPVRMEFDGDEIASMRRFDIETQRSAGETGTVVVHPVHHFVPDAAGLARLRERLELEAAALPPDERARALLPAERLESGISFYGMEHYAADVHDVQPVFSCFANDPLVVLAGAEELETLAREFQGEIATRFERSREEGHRYPAPDRVYVTGEELRERLASFRVLQLLDLWREGAARFETTRPPDYRRNLAGLERDVRAALANSTRVFLFCSNPFQRDRAEDLLDEVALEIDFPVGDLSSGFRWPDAGVLMLSEEEVFGRYHRPYLVPRAKSRSLTYDPSHFQPGDHVVHVDHGIGRYMGMRVLEREGGRTECLDIRYEGDDRLFIPVTRLRMVEKYVAAEGSEPSLARLGGAAWARSRERARKSAEKIARDLLELYAARRLAEGHAFRPDTPWQKEMEASFPYEETAHQLQASAEVKEDMESGRTMDRLLCGDVGFGKTEVALRAAFKAVMDGKQVAVLVPTTVLAMQHHQSIEERLRGFPVNHGMLSRFVTAREQKKTIEAIAAGRMDIVVGTHRLLSKDVVFRDLGLAVIDEEHRFGVRHKEAFKKLKKTVDVLSMTATPIPRTLSMALSGIRDFSVIDTPPRNRLPIHTEILPFDDERIRDAVMREVDRGGQVFFVHNRVQSIEVMEGFLRRLLPERVRIAHAHGQMKERELERRMIDFLERRFDVLVCTMIIEAGLDFPNVNTIIINRADRFGLAQLYQLRGRVGRSDRKAFAYLLVPRGRTLTPTAMKRLQAIGEFDYLGAGYRIAMRDLEIRGAGNLLGPQQSGQIRAVGLDLYSRMLRDEVARLRGEEPEETAEARVSMSLRAYLPGEYVADSEERMDIYRRLTRIETVDAVEDMRAELRDRFGTAPETALNMLRLVEIRLRARSAGIEFVEADHAGRLRVGFRPDGVPGRRAIARIVEAFAGRISFHAEGGFSLTVDPPVTAGRAGRSPREREEAALADVEMLLKLLEFSAT
ncbi:MAG: transcription-repair coupling factor [Candidatus Krumholzibacteriota bacterium]|nr:transcription-repair coupling factor [Candidatus Krumholzibacteriota bacterium]